MIAPGPVVALNRAVAVAETDGPAAALALVDGLDLDSYYLLHAIRGDLLSRLGRPAEAAGPTRRRWAAPTTPPSGSSWPPGATTRAPARNGECRGRYQMSRQPAARQRTHRCPWPGSRAAAGQSHGIQPTMTRPGPHG